MVARKQKERKALRSQYPLQGHVLHVLTPFQQAPLPNDSTNFHSAIIWGSHFQHMAYRRYLRYDS
jgi:hypothetical protein